MPQRSLVGAAVDSSRRLLRAHPSRHRKAATGGVAKETKGAKADEGLVKLKRQRRNAELGRAAEEKNAKVSPEESKIAENDEEGEILPESRGRIDAPVNGRSRATKSTMEEWSEIMAYRAQHNIAIFDIYSDPPSSKAPAIIQTYHGRRRKLR